MKYNFTGIEVNHIRKGYGKITKCDEMGTNVILSITFSESGETSRFVFPTTFLGPTPFLTSVDKRLQESLNEIPHCELCGSLIHISQYDNHYYCASCFKNLRKCPVCRHYKKKDFLSLPRVGDYPVYMCSECYEEEIFVCDDCGETFAKTYSLEKNKYLPIGKHLCKLCALNYLGECSTCRKLVSKEKLTEIGFKSFCPACKIKYTHNCSICGSVFYSTVNSNGLCPSCEKERQEDLKVKKYLEYWKTSSPAQLTTYSIELYRLKNTALVPFMSQFHPSQKYNQHLDRLSYDLLIIKGSRKDYALIHKGNLVSCPIIPIANKRNITMSEIKKDPRYFFFRIEQEDSKIEVRISSGKYLNIWEKAVQIRAMTYYDQDYRKEWHGDWLSYEGNNSGDTSDFYIIGTVK